MRTKSVHYVQLFVTLWMIVPQAPLSMGFSRQEYWRGMPFPPPRGLPDPGIEPSCLRCELLRKLPLCLPIYGWAGSFLWCSASSQQWPLCCRVYPVGARASEVVVPRLQSANSKVVVHEFSCSRHVRSSRTRDQTHVLCTGRQMVNLITGPQGSPTASLLLNTFLIRKKKQNCFLIAIILHNKIVSPSCINILFLLGTQQSKIELMCFCPCFQVLAIFYSIIIWNYIAWMFLSEHLLFLKDTFLRLLLFLNITLLSCFSHVRLCATTQMAAQEAPLSLGFSRQEHWSGLPFPSPMHESEKGK